MWCTPAPASVILGTLIGGDHPHVVLPEPGNHCLGEVLQLIVPALIAVAADRQHGEVPRIFRESIDLFEDLVWRPDEVVEENLAEVASLALDAKPSLPARSIVLIR